ncbi:MAG TPA: Flp family type IVb pilin [Gaiellaceae bacterium]|jgi:pilus assembly protein Flp/PilA|nr:Flp family type IVb pilin [Gaiellaceae bacterium]
MLEFAIQWMKDNVKREDGQTMAEYGLILALIAIVVAVVLVTLGSKISSTLSSVANAL